MCFLFLFLFCFFFTFKPPCAFLLLRTFFSSPKALHPTVFYRCSDRHFSLCPVVDGNSPREFRPFFPRIKILSWFIFMCLLLLLLFCSFFTFKPPCAFYCCVHFSLRRKLSILRSLIDARTVTFLCVQWSAETRLQNSVHSFRALWYLHGCILNCTFRHLIIQVQ